MRKPLLISGLCCGLALIPTTAVLAQTTAQTDNQRIQSLEARVKSLETRVAALEQRSNVPPVTSASASPRMTPVAPAANAPVRAAPAAVAAAAPTAADWSQLHRGMNPREVTAQIGPPENREVRPMSEIWFYPDNRQLEFDHNGRLDSWSKP